MEGGPLVLYSPSLVWESNFTLAQQQEFTSPSDLLVQGLCRRFIAWHENKLANFQKENILVFRFVVQEEIVPEEDPLYVFFSLMLFFLHIFYRILTCIMLLKAERAVRFFSNCWAE